MNSSNQLQQLAENLPKAELHLHIEGTLEPEMVLRLAKKNGVDLPYATADELKRLYNFKDLQSFLDLYYQATAVLQTEQDFFDLTWAYMQRCQPRFSSTRKAIRVAVFRFPWSWTAFIMRYCRQRSSCL
jgi:adenosine deaminase